MEHGLLIVIEGVDKSGKSSQIDELAKNFVLDGEEVVTIHFPCYDTPTGEIIEQILKGYHAINVYDHPLEFQALMSINRYEQQMRIESALMQGKIVICDRYIHSGFVYGITSGVPEQWLEQVQHSLVHPDIVVLLEIDEETYWKRCEGEELDNYEANMEFINSVGRLYRQFAEQEEWICLDGTLPVEEVAKFIYNNVKLKIAEMEETE